jgi:septal ring factor EnvC (AmiA/AmiB activator)
MKVLIEDLEKGLEVKALEFEKIYGNEKNEHLKTRTTLQGKIAELSNKIESIDAENYGLKDAIKATEEQLLKANNKLRQI